MQHPPGPDRLIAVELHESIGCGTSPEADHERRVAIYDLLEENTFKLLPDVAGPHRLILSPPHGRPLLGIQKERGGRSTPIRLSPSPFRRLVKDYFMVCESYYSAIKLSTPAQIETIDMARRGLHNEGSTLLQERLDGKVDMDFNTARRLFTLVCVLHWRG